MIIKDPNPPQPQTVLLAVWSCRTRHRGGMIWTWKRGNTRTRRKIKEWQEIQVEKSQDGRKTANIDLTGITIFVKVALQKYRPSPQSQQQ